MLIHEAYSTLEARNTRRPTLEFRRPHHTSSSELAEVANAVKPGLLVTYHRAQMPDEPQGPTDVLLGEIRQGYSGRIVAAKDLDIY